MASTKRQRELARRRAERQVARRVERRRARRRRTIGISLGTVALLVVGGVGFAAIRSAVKESPKPSPSASPAAPKIACGATKPPDPEKGTKYSRPPLTLDRSKTYFMTVKTSCGPIEWQLFDAQAPQTVNSLLFLAQQNYYDGTFCHRMTEGQVLTVLQCGDPLGTGTGGPGYGLPEENLPPAAQVDPTTKTAKYPRGIVAMARGPEKGSGGSQFFMVVKDSALAPDYTVLAKITKGLDVLDKIFALGIDPPQTALPREGKPTQTVYIEDVTVRVV